MPLLPTEYSTGPSIQSEIPWCYGLYLDIPEEPYALTGRVLEGNWLSAVQRQGLVERGGSLEAWP